MNSVHSRFHDRWFVARDSLSVKACHYARLGCGEISQRAALIGTAPTHTAAGRVFFLRLAVNGVLFLLPICDNVGDGLVSLFGSSLGLNGVWPCF